MAYIRSRNSELTGYQEHAPYNPPIDLHCDFVMVYGIDPTMPERIKKFKERGYVVHLMTGVAWGEYQDYLYGRWDGRDHWDEAQKDRNGKLIQHGHDVPYMIPTISFSEYLTEKLKIAVDSGVEAIHLEEPELFDHAGYSDAFKREYELYYRETWQPPHENVDTRYKASRLKAYLYARTLDRIFASLKEYAKVRYNRTLRFYVPTHSLLNYTQWKIVSPEGMLIDLPTVDGYIAQIWTGTSRTANEYNGIVKERTFEISFLEYGIMQELVKGTGRRMWFLHDPIEDNPGYTWENYRYNYLKTVTASLLHPGIHHFEICPWPNRVFNGVYPREKNHKPAKNAIPIPPHYATLLSSIFNTLGDMDQETWHFEGFNHGAGIFMSDSGLYQRTMPDDVRKSAAAARGEKSASETLPEFFGLALPLLKHGLPLRPVQLDNIRRFPAYLDDYKMLILTYEFMKPEAPDIHNALAAWVKQGGILIYVGDGGDPYHHIRGWWNTGKASYGTPAEHLFEMLDFASAPSDGIYERGQGLFAILNERPSGFGETQKGGEALRSFIQSALQKKGLEWQESNRMILHRGPYIAAAVMDESLDKTPCVLNGLFVDMFDPELPVKKRVEILPDGNALLFDLSVIETDTLRVIGTSARVLSLDATRTGFTTEVIGPDKVHAYTRLRLPGEPESIVASRRADGSRVPISFTWDKDSRTVLICYENDTDGLVFKGIFR